MFEDMTTTSQNLSSQEDFINVDNNKVKKETITPMKPTYEAPPQEKEQDEIGLGLFNYLESYRKQLEEMQQMDVVAKKQGRTLDLTSTTNTRHYRSAH